LTTAGTSNTELAPVGFGVAEALQETFETGGVGGNSDRRAASASGRRRRRDGEAGSDRGGHLASGHRLPADFDAVETGVAQQLEFPRAR